MSMVSLQMTIPRRDAPPIEFSDLFLSNQPSMIFLTLGIVLPCTCGKSSGTVRFRSTRRKLPAPDD